MHACMQATSATRRVVVGGEWGGWTPDERLCFSLFQRASAFSSLLAIHAFLLRRSLHANLPLLTRLLSAAAASPSAPASSILRYARRLFDRRPAQDPHLCNAMLRALVRHRCFLDSLALYQDLLGDDGDSHLAPFAPDGYTFPLLLKSCASLTDPDEQRAGLQLHGHIVKMGFGDHVFTATGLLDMYAKWGDTGSAGSLFDEMPEKSVASWTSMTVGYARLGDVSTAMELFRRMPDKDTAAFNAMVNAFVKVGNVGSARKLFDEMPVKNVVSWTTLLFGYCKAGDMDAARELFGEMRERNLYSWNVMIGGYSQNGQPQQALELFRELQSESCPFSPDEVTIVSIVPAIADLGAIELGRWIHKYARRRGLESVTSVSTALVDMYAKCGDIDEARHVFFRMPFRTTASWNAMINGLAVNGRAKEALDVFMDMQRSGVCPNEVTMVGVLSACSHRGLVDEGRRCFKEMEAYGIERRIDHYGCMVDLLGRGGYLEEAERLINEMPYNANAIILSSLLFACGCHGDVDRAERIMNRAAKIEPMSPRNYVMLRNLYAEKKRWRDVERIKDIMREIGGKREAGCSVIEIGNGVWEFVSGDRVHPDWDVISAVLIHLQFQMKDKKGEELEFHMIPFLEDAYIHAKSGRKG